MRAGVLMGLLLLAACGRSAPGGTLSSSPAAASADPADPGYRSPPHLLGLMHSPDGSVLLTGSAAPSSSVRLASPAGGSLDTTADGSGQWRAPLGPVSEPTLYGLSSESDGRRLQAEGYVAILPGAPIAALLRAGAGAQVLDGGSATLHILAIDLDGGGAAAVSGRAPTGVPVRVLVDGAQAMMGEAGADGRFSMPLPKPLAPGAHQIQVTTAAASAAFKVTAGPITPPTDGPYRVAAIDGGWRVDWITPGGGPQTTLLPAQGPAEPAR
jgi:hypothetical protein